jgi:hypothetical protein
VLRRHPRVLQDLYLDGPPCPWVGRPDTVKVLLLTLNPGYVPGESEYDSTIPGHTEENLATLTFGSRVPNWCFDRRLSATGGFRYWTRKLRSLTEAVGWDAVGEGVAWLEFFPYHSESYRAVPELVPSQHFNFDLLRDALQHGKPVVALRALRQWTEAVPELAGYPNLATCRNARVASVSPGNLGEEGFATLVAALS